jgi:CRISPR-associated protein Cas1
MLKISIPEKKAAEVPLREVESIIMGKGVQITSQALESLSTYAINIVYTSLGKPFGLYTPFANVGTVFTRRQQILAYEDWRGVHLAINFVLGTIENKRRLLLYFAKNRKTSNPQKAMRLKAGARHIGKMVDVLLKFSKTETKRKKLPEIRSTLMGIEGRATKTYFLEYGNLFSREMWTLHRSRRPPRDPLNSMLSLGYTIVQGHITTAIAAAGLELYAGFLHCDRSGKPSLALDLLEEFRQPIVDRLIARLVFKGIIKAEDFENSIHGFRLQQEKKKIYYEELRRAIMGYDESGGLFELSPTIGKNSMIRKLNYKTQMIRQARKVANFLIGANSEYKPFKMKW